MPAVNPALVETCTAPSNIACIKYWGKDSVALNTPINSSVSVTLDQRDLRAVTTVCASKDFATDQCVPPVRAASVDRSLQQRRARAPVAREQLNGVTPLTSPLCAQTVAEWEGGADYGALQDVSARAAADGRRPRGGRANHG